MLNLQIVLSLPLYLLHPPLFHLFLPLFPFILFFLLLLLLFFLFFSFSIIFYSNFISSPISQIFFYRTSFFLSFPLSHHLAILFKLFFLPFSPVEFIYPFTHKFTPLSVYFSPPLSVNICPPFFISPLSIVLSLSFFPCSSVSLAVSLIPSLFTQECKTARIKEH